MFKKVIHTLFIFVLLIVSGYLFFRLGETVYERYTLQRQIKEVQLRVSSLQKSTEDLKALLAQLGKEEFLKLKLKEELNVKELGEKVAVIRKRNEPVIKEEEVDEKNEHYLKDWWNLFFGRVETPK